MAVDPELLAILVCPKTKGPLELVELKEETRKSLVEKYREKFRDEEPVVGMASHEHGELTHRLVPLQGSAPAVSGLHSQILSGLPEANLRYVPDAVEAEERVRGGAAGAFFLPPMTVARVRSTVLSGSRLPEKSTYFWPKPRTGMVIRPHDFSFDGAVAHEPGDRLDA